MVEFNGKQDKKLQHEKGLSKSLLVAPSIGIYYHADNEKIKGNMSLDSFFLKLCSFGVCKKIILGIFIAFYMNFTHQMVREMANMGRGCGRNFMKIFDIFWNAKRELSKNYYLSPMK